MNEIMEILQSNLTFYEKKFNPSIIGNISKGSKTNELKELINKQIQIEEDIFELRFKKIIETQDPYLPPLDFELDQKNFYTVAPNLNLSLEQLIKLKLKIMNFILNLPNTSYDRYGYHWNEGHISLGQLVNRYVNNDVKFKEKIKEIIN